MVAVAPSPARLPAVHSGASTEIPMDRPGIALPCLKSLMLAAVATVALAGTAWLWSGYGAAVFFETIRTGMVACFG
jgi:hypothetical protein